MPEESRVRCRPESRVEHTGSALPQSRSARVGDRTWIVLAHCISHLSSNQSFLCDNAIFSLARLAQGEYQITAIFKYDASCSRQIPQIRSSFTPEHLCVVPLPPHGGTSHLRLKVDAGRSPFVDSPSGSSLTPLAFGSPVRLIFDGSSSPPREHRCVLPTVGCVTSYQRDDACEPVSQSPARAHTSSRFRVHGGGDGRWGACHIRFLLFECRF